MHCLSSGINVITLMLWNNTFQVMKHLLEHQASRQEHWDRIYQEIAGQYRLYRAQPQLLEILEGISTQMPKGMVLEVGCGKGNELIQCAKLGFRCVGVDCSVEALALLQEKLRHESVEVLLLRADARALPFPNESFDVVFSQGVLEHFRDPHTVLREQYRVLRPGGFIVAEVPNKWTLYTVYKTLLMAVGQWPPGWETQYSPRELRRLFQAQKFAIVDLVGWDFFILKVLRKIRRWLGWKDRAEGVLGRVLRQKFQRNPFLLVLFASITIVAQKHEDGRPCMLDQS